MITQQELVDRLNQLTLRYNLTWNDIKYDADKAIAKINAYLGARYPKMSLVMVAPHNGYTVNASGVQTEIFSDEYIHSIVIPYIAMEVLARDEEFTTIYKKYMSEFEDGLFTMFQKEFNRVPTAFRQPSDQGVFFEESTALATVARNLVDNLPTFKFRIYYHINNDSIVLSTHTSSHFLEDNRAYAYDEKAEIQGWNIKLLSFNGAVAYEFQGWMTDRQRVAADDAYTPGTQIAMRSDLHLYAKWKETSTMACTNTGVVSLKKEFANSISYLEIPNYINNILVREIKSYFCTKTAPAPITGIITDIVTDNLETIVLPAYLTKIQSSAFDNFRGTSIVFQETALSTSYGGITIERSAFANTPNLLNILIPANVVVISIAAFPVVSGKIYTSEQTGMVIRCRLLQSNVPDGWSSNWYARSSGTYVLEGNAPVWGYNG